MLKVNQTRHHGLFWAKYLTQILETTNNEKYLSQILETNIGGKSNVIRKSLVDSDSMTGVCSGAKANTEQNRNLVWTFLTLMRSRLLKSYRSTQNRNSKIIWNTQQSGLNFTNFYEIKANLKSNKNGRSEISNPGLLDAVWLIKGCSFWFLLPWPV